jgi:anti-anti-sigma factor
VSGRTVVGGTVRLVEESRRTEERMIESTDPPITTRPLAGEIDITLVPELEASLREQAERVPGNRVVFDCSAVTFIDSSGVAMMLAIEKRTGKRIQLANLVPSCRRVFEVTGLSDRIYEI